MQDNSCRAIHEANGRSSELDEDFHWTSDSNRNLFGFAKGESLRNELAKENMKIGDEGKSYRHSDQMRGEVGVRHPSEPVLEHRGHDRLADPAQSQTAKSDAELNSGQEIVQVLLETPHEPGARTALRNQLFDTGFTDADKRELGRDKEAVGQDEHHDRYAAKEQELKHLFSKVYNL